MSGSYYYETLVIVRGVVFVDALNRLKELRSFAFVLVEHCMVNSFGTHSLKQALFQMSTVLLRHLKLHRLYSQWSGLRVCFFNQELGKQI